MARIPLPCMSTCAEEAAVCRGKGRDFSSLCLLIGSALMTGAYTTLKVLIEMLLSTLNEVFLSVSRVGVWRCGCLL